MGPAEPTPSLLQVEAVYCPGPEQVDSVRLQLPPGSTVADALRLSGLLERHGLALDGLEVGIWGRVQPLATPLRERDRVELYRPLTVDPKEARRLRYAQHNATLAARRKPVKAG